eukprot:TRINITY_DN14797_c0_g1_i1.p1 TRINITY_DN14797_c0_g1~~TRINITY_DN14797_c0_g1_i1.p1  ORF type:complete len:62 (-),score=8.99 TRINITY_DN14797_c0_g1_i1:93-278(-)
MIWLIILWSPSLNTTQNFKKKELLFEKFADGRYMKVKRVLTSTIGANSKIYRKNSLPANFF